MEREKLDAILLLANITPVSVEQIPNEYCGPTCCPTKVWWLIDIPNVGKVKIGWRKRVINIDWSKTGIKLWEDWCEDNTTKSDINIHAWGYGRAIEYLEGLAWALHYEKLHPGELKKLRDERKALTKS